MPANVDAMIRAGAKAYRAGDKSEARALLERAIEIDEYNESAWLWLSAVVDSKDEQRTCLENVLIINPENDRARKGLRSLGVDPDNIAGGAAEAPPADDSAQQTPAFTEDIDEYNVPSSSASVSGGDEYSSDDYDQWMEDLDLGETTTGADTPAEAVGDAVFDDDDFGSGAFDDISFDDVNYDDYSYEDVNSEEEDVIFTGDYDYDDEAVSDDYAETEALFDDETDYATDDEFFDEGGYEDEGSYESEAGYDDGFFDYGEPASPDDALDESIFDDDMTADVTPGAIAEFEQIPAEIEPTRLPGEHEQGGSGGGLLTGMLVLFNLLAVGFIVAQFVL